MQLRNPKGGSTFQRTIGMMNLVFTTGVIMAGETTPPTLPPSDTSNSGDWCSGLQGMGSLYKNENSWLNEVKIFGRLQYQGAYVDGTAGTPGGSRDFHYSTDEVRRFYVGGSARMFDILTISGQANIYRDLGPVGGSEGFYFQHMWDLNARFDLKKAFDLDGFDALKFGYGAREVNMSNEWNTSSKNIKTVERSAISNKIWAYDTEFSNPTGAWLEGQNGNLAWTVGIFSTTQDDMIAPWDDGQLYYSNLAYDFSDSTGADMSKVRWTTFYQDIDAGEEALGGGIEWAHSLSVNYGHGPWEVMLEGIYGDNGDQGNAAREGDFWGLVFMPSYWINKDRLEAVFRYQYEGSEETQGIRVYSRYARRADSDLGLGMLNGGRGDEHHSFYGGVNYYLCDNNAKLMAGVQYDDISSDGADVYQGWTSYMALRLFF